MSQYQSQTVLETNKAVLIDAGDDFSIIVTEDYRGLQECWGTGNNLRGQLGINMTTHLHDMSKMVFEDDPIEPIKWDFLSSGCRHSIIALEEGGLFIWGDNEKGQIGNRKRKVRALPLLKQGFSIRFKIINVECSYKNSAVIVKRPDKK